MENEKNFSCMNLSQMSYCVNNERNSLCNEPADFGCCFPSLAMVYPAYQNFTNLYEVDKALRCGTLFQELYMPFEGYKVNMKGADGRCVR